MVNNGQQQETDLFDTRIDMSIIPISQLGPKSHQRLSTYLNAKKLLLSENSYQRDWRGLFDLAQIPKPYFQSLEASENPMKELLHLWTDEGQNATVATLQSCLIAIDRIDCLDDCKELFEEDAKDFYRNRNNNNNSSSSSRVQMRGNEEITEDMVCTMDDRRDMELGLPLQNYDAMLIYADTEDEDVEFARLLMKELTVLRDLRICSIDSILAGNPFEHDAKRTLLIKRCHRLIVILSASFSMSKQNKFLANLAQSIGIENQTRKLIPCAYKTCPIPDMFQYMTILNFERATKMYNFWDRLYESVKVNRVIVPSIEVTNASRISSSTSIQEQLRNSKTSAHLIPQQSKNIEDRDMFITPAESSSKRPIYPPVRPRRNSSSYIHLDDLNNSHRHSTSLVSLPTTEEPTTTSKSKSTTGLNKFLKLLSSKPKKDKKKRTALAAT